MIMTRIIAASLAVLALGLAAPAGAAILSGPPTYDFSSFGGSATDQVGYAFSAQTTTVISSFQAVTQGGNVPNAAQTYSLYDAAGSLLHSIDVAKSGFTQARPNSNDWTAQVNVGWDITAGSNYFLVGTNLNAGGDTGFTWYNDSSPVGLSNGDITITASGVRFNPATQTFQTNDAGRWYDIQSITTGAADVPEPASLAMLAIGLLGTAAARRRR